MHWLAAVLTLCGACGRLGFDADTDPDDSLIVWYQMEGATTGGLGDAAGDDNPASCDPTAACGTIEGGVYGNALHVTPNQFYRAASTSALVTPGAFTVAVWARVDKRPTDSKSVLVTKRQGAIHNSWMILVQNDLRPGFESVLGADVELVRGPPIPLATWLHLAISWDGAVRRIYVDGAQVAAEPTLGISFDTGEVLVGADLDDDASGLHDFFDGALDDLRIYDRQLSGRELLVLATPP